MRSLRAFVAIMMACSISYAAQWPKYQERSIPRTPRAG